MSTGTITPAKKGCERVDYEYDVSLRVWLLLAIFLTSGFGMDNLPLAKTSKNLGTMPIDF